MIHILKTHKNHFERTLNGEKHFEIRYNADRGFQKGDTCILQEIWINVQDGGKKETIYTGREIMVEITYVTNCEQQQNFVVFGHKEIGEMLEDFGYSNSDMGE